MANLGAIGNKLNIPLRAYPLTNNSILGPYKVSGTAAIDSVNQELKIFSYSGGSFIPNKQTTSSSTGSYTISNIPANHVTIIGYDVSMNKQSEAITVIPQSLIFGETTPGGWDITNSGANLTRSGQTITNNSGNALAETAISERKHEHRPFIVEFLVNSVNGSGGSVGLATVDATSTDVVLGTDDQSIGWFDNGEVKVNNVVVNTIGSWQANDILKVFYEKGKVWFARVRAGAVTYYGNIFDKTNPVYTFPTGYTFGYASTPYNLNDEFIVRGLPDTLFANYNGFIPWEAIDE